jgi:hypothetical protein
MLDKKTKRSGVMVYFICILALMGVFIYRFKTEPTAQLDPAAIQVPFQDQSSTARVHSAYSCITI